MWAAGRFVRQGPAAAAAWQFAITSASTLPLLPGDGAQPPPDPFIKFAQHRRGLTEAEVAAPTDQVDGQLPDDMREAFPARAPRQSPNRGFKPSEGLRRNAPSRLSPGGEAKAQ